TTFIRRSGFRSARSCSSSACSAAWATCSAASSPRSCSRSSSRSVGSSSTSNGATCWRSCTSSSSCSGARRGSWENELPAAPRHPRPAVGLHLHELGADGPARPGELRAWRVHGDRRLYGRHAVEPLRPVALVRRARRARLHGGGGARHRLPVLSLPHRGSLLRAGHPC